MDVVIPTQKEKDQVTAFDFKTVDIDDSSFSNVYLVTKQDEIMIFGDMITAFSKGDQLIIEKSRVFQKIRNIKSANISIGYHVSIYGYFLFAPFLLLLSVCIYFWRKKNKTKSDDLFQLYGVMGILMIINIFIMILF